MASLSELSKTDMNTLEPNFPWTRQKKCTIDLGAMKGRD